MKVIPFEKQQELTPDDILINDVIHQEKIGSYTSAVKMLTFFGSILLILTFVYGILIFGIPSLIYNLMGVSL